MQAASYFRRASLLALLLGSILALVSQANAQALAPSRNPYDAQAAGLIAELRGASPPQAAVLLRRIYELREYVDDPAQVAQAIAAVAADCRRHALVRDEAQHLLALIDVHENRLPAARARLERLGFIRDWAIVGPFPNSQGLDATFRPDQG